MESFRGDVGRMRVVRVWDPDGGEYDKRIFRNPKFRHLGTNINSYLLCVPAPT